MAEGHWWDWVMACSDRAWGCVKLSESGRGEWWKWDGVAEWNERVRIGLISLYIYIYIWFFGNFSFNRVRVGFESTFGFYFKHSNPTLLFHGSGKTHPLRIRCGRAGYPLVRYFLPYLIENPIDDVYRLKTVTRSMSQLYHCFVMFTSRCSSTTTMWSWKFGCWCNKQ